MVIIKKLYILIAALVLLLVGCGDDNNSQNKNNKENNNEPDIEVLNNEQENENNIEENNEVEENEKEISLEKEMTFSEFTVNLENALVYEEDGKDLVEVKYSWTNQAGDGKKYFFALTTNDVFQGDEVLTEITGAADMENKKTNSYHEHNSEGGTVNIRLVYELVDNETPITLRFKPLNDFDEDAQEVTVEIN